MEDMLAEESAIMRQMMLTMQVGVATPPNPHLHPHLTLPIQVGVDSLTILEEQDALVLRKISEGWTQKIQAAYVALENGAEKYAEGLIEEVDEYNSDLQLDIIISIKDALDLIMKMMKSGDFSGQELFQLNIATQNKSKGLTGESLSRTEMSRFHRDLRDKLQTAFETIATVAQEKTMTELGEAEKQMRTDLRDSYKRGVIHPSPILQGLTLTVLTLYLIGEELSESLGAKNLKARVQQVNPNPAIHIWIRIRTVSEPYPLRWIKSSVSSRKS